MAAVVAGEGRPPATSRRVLPACVLHASGVHDNCIVRRMVIRCPSMKIFRWRIRGIRLGERELRAVGDMLDQLRPRRVLRDARDFALKFQRDEVFRDYVLSRIWAVLPVVLVFILVSTICSIDIMFRTVRLVSEPPVWLRFFAVLLVVVGVFGE